MKRTTVALLAGELLLIACSNGERSGPPVIIAPEPKTTPPAAATARATETLVLPPATPTSVYGRITLAPSATPKPPENTPTLVPAEIKVNGGSAEMVKLATDKYAKLGPGYTITVEADRVVVSRVNAKPEEPKTIAVNVSGKLISVGSIGETLAVSYLTDHSLKIGSKTLNFKSKEELDFAVRALVKHDVNVGEIKDRDGKLLGYGWFDDKNKLVADFNRISGQTVLNNKNGFKPGPVQILWLAGEGEVASNRLETQVGFLNEDEGSLILLDKEPVKPIFGNEKLNQALAEMQNNPREWNGWMTTPNSRGREGVVVKVTGIETPVSPLTGLPSDTRKDLIVSGINGEKLKGWATSVNGLDMYLVEINGNTVTANLSGEKIDNSRIAELVGKNVVVIGPSLIGLRDYGSRFQTIGLGVLTSSH